jgi:Predicted phosphoesterase (MutT family)
MASEFLSVAEHILAREGRPLKAKEIVQIAIQNRLFSDKVAGKTPHQTMKSKLSVDIRRHDSNSRFLRTGPGRFYLRRLLPPSHPEYRAPPFEKPVSHEPVLVFPASCLAEDQRFQGISTRRRTFVKRLLQTGKCRYLDRAEAEATEEFKQIVTYVMITRRGSVLCFKRGSYSLVAEFLRGAHCVGFGGHVTEADNLPLFPVDDMGVRECVLRELSEELQLPLADERRLKEGKRLKWVGVLNDDSSAVGRRHLAVVFQYEVSKSDSWQAPQRGEKSVTQLRWLRPDRATRIWDFEYWSQLCLQRFFPDVVRATSDYKIIRPKAFRLPHLLCVLGEVGSGKTEVTRMLTSQFGYVEVNSGRLVAEILGVPPVPQTPRGEFQERAWKFISSPDGPKTLATAIVRRANDLNSERILIDGVRQPQTLAAMRGLLSERRVPSIYVHTLPHLAFRFYQAREGVKITILDFLKVRSAPVERDVPTLISSSDAVIYNWTGKARFHRTIRRTMAELGIGPCQ